jgi:hypothetical protein
LRLASAKYAKTYPDRVNKKNVKWRKQNREKVRESNRASKKRNFLTVRAINANRRAVKLKAMPWWVDKNTIKKIYENCPKNKVVDHIIPLISPIVCGLHVPWNLQYLTPSANSVKGNRLY